MASRILRAARLREESLETISTTRERIFNGCALIERVQQLSSEAVVDLNTVREGRELVARIRAGNDRLRSNLIVLMALADEIDAIYGGNSWR
jgi:hypothetical protein